MATVDITVRGAGIFGLSIAWEAVTRGAKVRVIDPGGVAAGASGGIVGALAPHVPENWNPKKAFQLESLLGAERFWQKVHQAGGLDPGYARTGRLQPLADEHAVELARGRARGAADLWQGRASWTVTRDVGDWAPPSPSGWWVHDSLSGRIHPAQACQALAAAIMARGGEILRDGPEDGAIIWATGAVGLSDLSKAFGKSLGMGIKGQAALFRLDRRDAPQLFAQTLHIVPHGDGTVAVGSTTEREYASATQTDEQLDRIIETARSLCPSLEAAPVIQRWAGLRPRAKSRAPMLGSWPGRPGHFIANGGFKIGFGMAPGVARVMAALVLDGRRTIPEGFGVEDNL